MDYKKVYEFWLNDDFFDEETKNELREIINDEKEIEDRFYKDLDFGTAGLRGVIGAGTNRMNIYTVSKATQGFANYIIKQGKEAMEKGIAIAYDSRIMSPEFANTTALVLNANGIKTYIYSELRPVPMLSFAVRRLDCIGGVVITASHNPREYNGYKVYWSDGGQVPSPRDREIIDEVNKITDFKMIKTMSPTEAMEKGLYNIIKEEVEDDYISEIKKQLINPEMIEKVSDDFKIVYTPLHGSGNKPVRRILSEVGFKNVYVVKEQEEPDGNFPTAPYPNPEDPKAFTLALELAEKVKADIIIGTDPDADRCGAMVKKPDGQYLTFTGNMIGSMLCEYILSQRSALNKLPENPAVVSTIVSTKLTEKIAEKYGADYYEVLTGFKYIGDKIKLFENTNCNNYVFGFEESYGFLAGTHARDKDAVVSSMLLCEMAAYYKTRGMSLYDGLMEIYEKYGFYKESTKSITLKGLEGLKDIQKIMDSLKAEAPDNFAGLKVTKVRNYETSVIKEIETGNEEKIDLPKSNVIYFELEDNTWICVRPSGTEPKIKFYIGVVGKDKTDAENKVDKLNDSVMEIVDNILK